MCPSWCFWLIALAYVFLALLLVGIIPEEGAGYVHRAAHSTLLRKPAQQRLSWLQNCTRDGCSSGTGSHGVLQGSHIPAPMAADHPLMVSGELWLYQQEFHRQAVSPGSLALTSPQEPVGFSGFRSFPPAGGGSPSGPFHEGQE